jgi:perosamine synthetase
MKSTESFASDVVKRISSAFSETHELVSLHEPRFFGNEKIYLNECIDSTFVSSVGRYVTSFEDELASYTGAKHAIAIVNGTSALHLSLKVAGVGVGDEVLVPALTFVATANAITYCGAIPHFIDSEENTMGVDPLALDSWLDKIGEVRNDGIYNIISGRKIKALIVMHAFGHPCKIDALVGIANKYGLTVIEDAAESLGSFYKGAHTGTFAKMGVLSFNGNKIITTGGGGAILTNDGDLAHRLKHLSTTAKITHPWEFIHDEIGYNYRMPNINAALGCAQLEQINNFITSKRNLYRAYVKQFEDFEGAIIIGEPVNSRSNFWLQTLMLDKKYSSYRDEIIKRAYEKGVMTRPAWTLMHQLPAFKDCPHAPLAVAENIVSRLISIPSSAGLATE